MRILIDIRHLCQEKQSGVGEYTKQLLHGIFKIDQENEYILFSTGRTKPKEEHGEYSNVLYRHIKTPNQIINTKFIFLKHPSINWYVKETIDLIFLPNLNITVLPNDIPCVLTVHDMTWKIFPEFYSKKMQAWHNLVNPKKLIDNSSKIITPSQTTKNDLQNLFKKNSEAVTVIPHGCDLQFTQKMEARDHGVRSKFHLPKKFVLFIGTLEPRKNLLALIQAVDAYRRITHDDLHLVIAGKWGWKSHNLRRRLWKKDVKSWVHQMGYIPDKDRAAIYRSSEALMWPSIYEGFGLPILEAMSCGTPVITSHTSSIPELTNDCALLIDPYNINDITDALIGLMQSKPLQKQLSNRGIERAKNYNWNKSAIKTLELFETFK
jgi:glycosyltransferase involved in cell wall biosynthesis